MLVLVLNKEEEHLERILERFVEIGIRGATIIDSTGMGQTLACHNNLPIFGGLRRLFENCRPGNKTVFSVIDNEERLQKAKTVVQEEIGDFTEPGVGILFTIPVNNVLGLAQDINDKEG